MKKIIYKVCDYPNINHHNYVEVENNLNNSFGNQGFELITIIDFCFLAAGTISGAIQVRNL